MHLLLLQALRAPSRVKHIFHRTMASVSDLKNLEVIPDVIDGVQDDAGDAAFNIVYSGGEKVECGNVLTPTQVKDAPTVSWAAENDTFYTLCMTDPDAPSRAEPKFREWHHWLVGNIPGGNLSDGEVLSAYVGAGPPNGTGLHRYCFLLFKQPGKLTFDEKRLPNTSADGRPMFKIREFAQKHGLGQPIAASAFQAEYDDYVPKLYEQLSGK